ncbi:MAG: sulfotransferase domain-containing protein [Hormoscilla sp. GM7CHS1pb]|nr:sulfotransferase domain-containing protein [Hormoscilla sp. GM7CHS1pb]
MIRETTKKAIKRGLSFFGYKLERLDSISSITQILRDTLDSHKNVPKLKTDDVFLVSYPRSGNTWVKNIIAHILYPHERIYSLNYLARLVPEIHEIDSDNEYSNPRVIKTHRSFPFRQERENSALYSQVIYIVRHPFDVIRSLHYFNSYLNPKQTIDQTVCKVTMGGNKLGSWQDHVLSWKLAEKNAQMLLIRYEDMSKKRSCSICWWGVISTRE